jgi:hypothetical protein
MPLVLDGTTGFSGGGGVATSTALGSSALFTNSTGTNLVAIGYQAGYFTTAGSNVFVGSQAGYTNSTGTNNIGIGYQAGYSNTTASNNTAVGYQANYSNQTMSNTTAIGYQAGYTNTGDNELVAVGYRALYLATTGTNNTALGHNTLAANTTGSHNLAVGSAALTVNTTGSYNTAIGRVALVANTTGSNNTAVGYQALNANTTGTQNTAIGREAGKNITTANYNCFVGDGAGTSTTGSRNTFIGQGAGNAITTGANNSIMGGYSGNGSPIGNTGSGYIVLADGNGNVKQFWHSDGYWEYVNNTSLRLPSTGGTGYIGYIADSSSIQISYNSTGNGVRLTSGATSWSTWSDQRLKNITGTYTTPLADISQLQPIKFTWKSDEENIPQVGILAQSVQPVVPEAVEEGTISLEDETKYLTVRYTELIPLMVASIQELKTLVDAQSALITGQAAEIVALKSKVGL